MAVVGSGSNVYPAAIGPVFPDGGSVVQQTTKEIIQWTGILTDL
jgi:hypothetical protein